MDYLIAATPRVGSNLLCSLIGGTKLLGMPRETLCPSEFGDFQDRIKRDPRGFEAYYASCQARAAARGPFGVKAHLHQLAYAVELGFDLAAHWPSRVVYLRRKDVLGQAISHVRAKQTGAWISAKEERFEPSFDAVAIHRAIELSRGYDQGWEEFFERHRIEPYRLTYEDLCDDFEGELSGVVTFLGVDPAGLDIPRVVAASLGRIRKQRDERSDAWRARYTAWLAAEARVQASTDGAARAAG